MLVVSLEPTHIEAAGHLHAQLLSWVASEQALHALGQRFPEFDFQATLLKAVAINQLYGTYLYHVIPMAHSIVTVLERSIDTHANVDLVAQLAALQSLGRTNKQTT